MKDKINSIYIRIKAELDELNEIYNYLLEQYDKDGILSIYDENRMIEIRSQIRAYEKVLKMIEGDDE